MPDLEEFPAFEGAEGLLGELVLLGLLFLLLMLELIFDVCLKVVGFLLTFCLLGLFSLLIGAPTSSGGFKGGFFALFF